MLNTSFNICIVDVKNNLVIKACCRNLYNSMYFKFDNHGIQDKIYMKQELTLQYF